MQEATPAAASCVGGPLSGVGPVSRAGAPSVVVPVSGLATLASPEGPASGTEVPVEVSPHAVWIRILANANALRRRWGARMANSRIRLFARRGRGQERRHEALVQRNRRT